MILHQLTNISSYSQDIPLFLNYAAPEQNVLATYGKYAELQATKRKYDPTGFFSSNQPGPRVA